MKRSLTAVLFASALFGLTACESTPETTQPSTMPTTAAAMGAINDKCPISGKPVSDSAPTVSYGSQEIGFCCAGCVGRWNDMSDHDRRVFAAQYR
ncbi:MAG: hypothetical protein GY715_05125 [Planctomycetes bacterium]|nr:hypothetical protein [Planctomycetota bacterium]